jgi:putative ABC transport system substrate-binding protein
MNRRNAAAVLVAVPLGALAAWAQDTRKTGNSTFQNWPKLAALAQQSRLPTRCEAQAGGLVSYGPTFDAFSQRVARPVDRILRGRRPRDLPIERSTKFELVINLKTARAVGLTIPTRVPVRADEVIE